MTPSPVPAIPGPMEHKKSRPLRALAKAIKAEGLSALLKANKHAAADEPKSANNGLITSQTLGSLADACKEAARDCDAQEEADEAAKTATKR